MQAGHAQGAEQSQDDDGNQEGLAPIARIQGVI
jgi:hypothetical protein